MNQFEQSVLNEISGAVFRIQNAFLVLASDLSLPHVMYKPRVFKDGNQWCALLGNNIQEGVCGFGETPMKACYAFDNEWHGWKTE